MSVGGEADRAAVHPAVGVRVHAVEHPDAALGVAADANAGLVHFLVKAAVRVGVLIQKPRQGGVRRVAGAGAGVVIAHHDKAPGGHVLEHRGILECADPGAVDHHHHRILSAALGKACRVVGHELSPVLFRGGDLQLFHLIAAHRYVFCLDGPARLNGPGVILRGKQSVLGTVDHRVPGYFGRHQQGQGNARPFQKSFHRRSFPCSFVQP